MKYLDEITRLSNIWYEYVSFDHHKDRDCHFYIDTVWSYGKAPYYRVNHAGYIMDDWTKTADTYEEAERLLYNKLYNEIESAIKDTVCLLEESEDESNQMYDTDREVYVSQLAVLNTLYDSPIEPRTGPQTTTSTTWTAPNPLPKYAGM